MGQEQIQDSRRTFGWLDFEDLPTGPGIYAWHYMPQLSDADISMLIGNLPQSSQQATAIRRDQISRFLQQHLFDCIQEKPYQAELTAPLKPSYSGNLNFESTISETLVKEIEAQPERLFQINKVLQAVRHEFTPPIYIGMAHNIRARILRHKSLICKIQNSGAEMEAFVRSVRAEDVEARNFAEDVVARKMSTARLRVSVQTISAEEKIHNNVENILNRLSLPLCGRK